MSQFDIGDKVKLIATFKNESGELADPTAITVKIRKPDKSEASHSYPVNVVKSSAGVYYYYLTFDASGSWFYRWVGTGAVHTASEGRLVVNKTAFDAP